MEPGDRNGKWEWDEIQNIWKQKWFYIHQDDNFIVIKYDCSDKDRADHRANREKNLLGRDQK